MRFFKRLRARREQRRAGSYWGTKEFEIPRDWPDENGVAPKKEGIFTPARLRERIANRRKFRAEVSGNRKWIMIGVAVVAICGTIVYLSITYGGGLVGLLL